MFPRIREVQYISGYRLQILFDDGTQGEIDFHQRVLGRGGVFSPLEDLALFRQVSVDPEAGTLRWPNDVELCPDVLYSAVTGHPIPEPALSQL